jgi:hypothetical protein
MRAKRRRYDFEKIRIAMGVVREFLPIYEEAYPGDFRPRAACNIGLANPRRITKELKRAGAENIEYDYPKKISRVGIMALKIEKAAWEAACERSKNPFCPGLCSRIAEAASCIAHMRWYCSGWEYAAVGAICRGLPANDKRREELLKIRDSLRPKEQ